MNTKTRLKELFHNILTNPEQVEPADIGELPFDLPDPEQMIEDGADPQFAMYSIVQAQLLTTAIMLENSGEADDYHSAVEAALDQYFPGYPPISPVTDSCFYLWAMCDLRFGPDRENIGRIAVELMRESGAPADLLAPCERLLESRMGIYETIGEDGEFLIVRELVTNRQLLVEAPTEYHDAIGELRFVRLAPPLRSDFEYYSELTTPYVLQNQSADRWSAYLESVMPDAVVNDDGTRSTDVADRLASVFKDDCGSMPWLEFIFQGYHHYQDDAIFLHGIPDDPDSLPHGDTAATSPELAENEMGFTVVPQKTRVRPETVEFSLTQPQRKIAAELLPELSDSFQPKEKSKRRVTVPWSDGEHLGDAVEEAIEDAEGSRFTTMRNLWHVVTDTLDSAAGIQEAIADGENEVIFRMRIDLCETDPSIWRRVEVPDCTLSELHDQIQCAMGWENAHMYQFRIHNSLYSMPEYAGQIDALDDDDVLLSDFLERGSEFIYEYDFGDDWEHHIEVEKVFKPDTAETYPRCVKGRGNCPVEDCGGVYGYYDRLEAMSDPEHPDHEELKEWYGDFDPNQFDAAEISGDMHRRFEADDKARGEFNIHADLFVDGDLDEEAFGDYCDDLLDEFADSPEFDDLPEGDYGYVGFLLDFSVSYLGVTPATMTVRDLNEVLFSIIPRKVGLDPEEADKTIVEYNAFFRFIHREYGIAGALKLAESMDETAASRLEAELKDDSNFGMAKSLFTMGKTAGYDMTTEEGMNQFMQFYNSSLKELSQGKLSPMDNHIQPPVAAVSTIKRTAERVGRNEPCPCGSGRKYKKCCLKSEG